MRESVYGKQISEFAVGQCPAYRRHRTLRQAEPVAPDRNFQRCNNSASFVPQPAASADSTAEASAEDTDASQWESFFAKDVRSLAAEIFVHIC